MGWEGDGSQKERAKKKKKEDRRHKDGRKKERTHARARDWVHKNNIP